MSLNLLLVEDDQDIRAIIKKACEFEKITVFEADNCGAALKLFRQEKPDLIYLDIFLSAGEIGLDLVQEFCGPSIVQRPKVMVVSGEIGQDVFNTLGFNQPHKVDLFVLKPFDPKDLISKMLKIFKAPATIQASPLPTQAVSQVPVSTPAKTTLAGTATPAATTTTISAPIPTPVKEPVAEPKTARDFFILGLHKFAVEDLEGALAMFTKAIELNPGHAGAYSYRAFCRDRLGNKAGAESDFEECQKLGGL